MLKEEALHILKATMVELNAETAKLSNSDHAARILALQTALLGVLATYIIDKEN